MSAFSKPFFLLILITVCSSKAFTSSTEFRCVPQFSQQPSGSVNGRVVTIEGEPVGYAKVYARKIGEVGQGGLVPLTDADQLGRFTLSGLSSGEYVIVAFQEAEGYPDLTFSFYSRAYTAVPRTRVRIVANQVTQGAMVRVGAKAARLLIAVLDADTMKAVRDAQVTLNYKSNPKIYLKFGATDLDGNFNLLVPSSIAINMEVFAPGYNSWRYSGSGAARVIQLEPASEKRIVVHLTPTK